MYRILNFEIVWNFKEILTNDIVSYEQPGPDKFLTVHFTWKYMQIHRDFFFF